MSNPSQRNQTLDLLRGYFLVVILIDHLARFPGLFDLVTGRGWLWASAAEGFFLISGMMVGVVRGKEARRGDAKGMTLKLWRRAAELYAWSVGLTIAFTVAGWHLWGHSGLKSGIMLPGSWVNLLTQSLSFHYIYGWADFLPYYAAFMLFAPLAVYAANRRQGWLVVAASAGLWLLRGSNFYLAWQPLFFGGILAGYYLESLESWVAGLKPRALGQIRRLWYGATWATVVLSAVLVHLRPWLEASVRPAVANLGWWLQFITDKADWFDKPSMAPGRLIIAALWFGALYGWIRSHERQVQEWLGWLLLPLGRNCLFIYGFEAAVITLQAVIWPYAFHVAGWNISLNILAIGAIWLAAQLKTRLDWAALWRKLAISQPALSKF